MINDMTKGNPLSLIFWFSIPLLIGNIFQQLYNIADIVIVGRTLGINALAAVGAISPIFFFIMFVVVGLTNGFAVITGQRFGAKDFDGVRRSVTVSTILSTIFTLFYSVLLAVFMDKILTLMNVPQEIYKDAYWYIQIVIAGLWVCNFYNLLANIVRALGDSKTPLYFLIFASILNVFGITVYSCVSLGGSGFCGSSSPVTGCIGCFVSVVCKKTLSHTSFKKIRLDI